MKKMFLIPALLLSLSVYGQMRDFDLIISELSKFEAVKEKVYSVFNKEDTDLTIMYENGICAYIYIDAEEGVGRGVSYKNHKLIITYFISKLNLFVKNKDDKKEILSFIKQEIDKNEFILDYFFNEAYEIALEFVDENAIETNDGFTMFSGNLNWSSELVIRVSEIWENQYIVNVYYNIVL